MLIKIRPLFFWLGFALNTCFFAATLILLLPIPIQTRLTYSRYWCRFNSWWLKITCDLDHSIEGLENIPDQPVIVMCKHQSTWETIVLQDILPPQVWVLKRELMWIPIFGWGVFATKPIALDRKAGRKAVEQLLEQGGERLRNGLNVLIFPEGTRSKPGHMNRYKMGGALLAEKTNTPVLPVAHNAGYKWPRRSWIKKPGTIQVRIGPLIQTEGMSAEQILQATQKWIEYNSEEIALKD